MSSLRFSLDSNTKSNDFPGANFNLSPNQQEQLQDVAIRHIGLNTLKALQAIQRIEFIEARNRIEIPHGLFGLSFDSFFNRRNDIEDTVYIDVLQLACKIALEQTKICVVLDDLQDFVRKLFQVEMKSNDMEQIIREISNSQNLLTINETIANDFQKNTDLLKKLQDKLNAFNVRETNAILYVNSQVYGVQNDCVEAELVMEPIEMRYKMSFYKRTTEQSMAKALQAEGNLQKKLDDIEMASRSEYIASQSIEMKQRMDIEFLKSRIQEMTEKYDREYEVLDGQISYKSNAIDAMRDHHRDCLEKLEFYKSDIGRLRDWQEMWKQKKIEEAEAELRELKTKKKKVSKKATKKKK